MDWKLWLDNQGTPNHHAPFGFVGADSLKNAFEKVREFGPPSFIVFDYDSGKEEVAKDFIKWLYANYPNSPPEDWAVHFTNPVAKDWIDSFINGWRRSLKGE